MGLQTVALPSMRLFLLFALALAAISAASANADPVADAIRAGGVALLMRHATAPGTGDPDNFRLGDCASQRNLSDEGRAQARRIGAHLASLGLASSADILTSQWCRCRETATLAFGRAQDWPALNSFLRSRADEPQQRRAVVERIANLKPGDRPLVLVTHQVMVTAVTGVYPQSGEVVVVAPTRTGGKPAVRVIGSIKPDQAK